jgi:hypothetical protein
MRILLILCFLSYGVLYGQLPSKEIAIANFKSHIDSVLSKEVSKENYHFFDFSELEPIYGYPDELIALIDKKDFANPDEYYGAFLYRQKYQGHDFSRYNLEKMILKHASNLVVTILKGIRRGTHYSNKEDRLRKVLLKRITKIQPPVSGYMQHARLTYTHEGQTETTEITVLYSVSLTVHAYGRKVSK